jgi:hypothetical protein
MVPRLTHQSRPALMGIVLQIAATVMVSVSCLAAHERGVLVPRLPEPAEALLEMSEMGVLATCPTNQVEILTNVRTRGEIRRLVSFLGHSDQRVNEVALQLLTRMPQGAGTWSSPELWEAWLGKLERTLNIRRDTPRVGGWNSTEDVLFDILRTRSTYSPLSRMQSWNRPRFEAAKRLVSYVRHPDRRVRSAAVSTFSFLTPGQVGSADCLEVAEQWLTYLEQSVPKQIYLEPPEDGPSWQSDVDRRLTDETQRNEICDLLTEMLGMEPKSKLLRGTFLGNDKLVRRELARRLVSFARHTDKRVSYSALELLKGLEPNLIAEPDAPEAWERWLTIEESSRPVEHPQWTFQGTAIGDVFHDIIHIRLQLKPMFISDLLNEPSRRARIRRLVMYLRHPNRNVRTAAYKVLRALQEQQPGGPDSADLWEDWFNSKLQGFRRSDILNRE